MPWTCLFGKEASKMRSNRYQLLATSFAFLLFGCGDDAKQAPADAAAPLPDAPVDTPTGPLVQTTAGPVRGSATASMQSFRGIPYAAPPVGPLRWKPPTAPAAFTAERDATRNAAHCAQTASPFGVASTSEDCLYLNVFAPTTAGPHPVMFWMHGGALFLGQSDEYDATPLVAQGVVVVTINYRLGMLGFMSHPALSTEQAGHSGNYGLMDQQLALHWVQDNIAKFGGDKANVTIFGESAGGLSVHSQLVMAGSAGLFHKAIIESGAYANSATNEPTLATAEGTGKRLVGLAGCADPCSLTDLRALTVDKILMAQTQSGISTWIPSIDGAVITGVIGAALAAGTYNKVPIIQGSNHDEYRLFVGLNELTSGHVLDGEADYEAAIAGVFTQAAVPALTAKYPLASYSSASIAFGTLGTDLIFACNSRVAAKALSTTTPTFVYEFNDPAAPQMFLPPAAGFTSYGAYHASELQYLWALRPTLATTPALTTDQKALGAIMVKYWTNFAKTGDPNSTGLPAWPMYTAATDSILSLAPGSDNVKVTTAFAADHKCAP
jgi:para-nitrobenzyl esterase